MTEKSLMTFVLVELNCGVRSEASARVERLLDGAEADAHLIGRAVEADDQVARRLDRGAPSGRAAGRRRLGAVGRGLCRHLAGDQARRR